MNNLQNINSANMEQYNSLCQDFDKKTALMNKWLESSTEDRKKMTSYKILKKEAFTALKKLENWINENS